MSRRRRTRTPRRGSAVEWQAWEDVFRTGCDFFGDLEKIGIDFTLTTAREAWQRFGTRFMETWKPPGEVPEETIQRWEREVAEHNGAGQENIEGIRERQAELRLPWAFREFGAPPGWTA